MAVQSNPVSTGHTNFESKRGGFRDTSFTNATSDYGTDTFAAHIRYGYAIEAKQWYVRPILDAGWTTTISRGGFTEEGSGPTNLVVDASSEELVTLQPAIEIGGEVGLPSGAKMRGWVRGGVTELLSGEDVGVTARFEGAPIDVAPMTFSQSLDKSSTDVAVGIDVLTQGGFALRMMYSQQGSENARTEVGSLKVSGAF